MGINTTFKAFAEDFKKYETLDTELKRETIATPTFVRNATPYKMNQQIYINGTKLSGINKQWKNK